MKSVSERIYNAGILPVVAIEDAKNAVPLAKALLGGGLGCAEITFRTGAAHDAIQAISRELPQMLVGAGTVLTIAQAESAVEAGAEFIVTPGFNEAVVKWCIDHAVPIFPGCNTPQAIESALSLGLNQLKFFPAELSGGLAMIKALCAPYSGVRFIPTGGISEKNLNEYLAFDKVLACGGTWMVKPQLVDSGHFDEIESLTRQAVNKMLGFEILHIGINNADADKAIAGAKLFSSIFGLSVKTGDSSSFAGTQVEFMNAPGYGVHGHIAVGTNNVDRAVAYLEQKGVSFNTDTIKRDENGRIKFVYLSDEICGFAIHLIKK